MKQITVSAPRDRECDAQEWNAAYKYSAGSEEVRFLSIESRSVIDVVIAKREEESRFGTQESYYISVPNFMVAIPSISSLLETFWITEKLLYAGMSAPDAVTVAQVLRDMNDF